LVAALKETHGIASTAQILSHHERSFVVVCAYAHTNSTPGHTIAVTARPYHDSKTISRAVSFALKQFDHCLQVTAAKWWHGPHTNTTTDVPAKCSGCHTQQLPSLSWPYSQRLFRLLLLESLSHLVCAHTVLPTHARSHCMLHERDERSQVGSPHSLTHTVLYKPGGEA